MKRQENKRPSAKKSLGQNFLTDPNIIRKIVEAVRPSASDAIIEIGPGRGALTEKLVESGASVLAIELDRDLAKALSEQFADNANVRVIEEDVLNANFGRSEFWPPAYAGGSDMKLVANLPYYISTAILQRLADQRRLFSGLVLMFQREVVERIKAGPGNSERGYLTVIVEACFEVEKLFDVPPAAFRPVPKVWSSVVRLIPKEKSDLDEAAFRDLLSVAFAQKRKTILNNLRTSYSDPEKCLEQAGIEPRRRAESITLEEWIKLNQCITGQSRRDILSD
jgi:16S rRNA (adenine1518-N6/adenine1519-N6)-dimethyltransferase